MGAYYIKTIKGMEEAGDELELELLKEEKYDSLERASDCFLNEFTQRISQLDTELEDWEDFPVQYEAELPSEEIKIHSQFIGVQNTLKKLFFHVLLIPEELNFELED